MRVFGRGVDRAVWGCRAQIGCGGIGGGVTAVELWIARNEMEFAGVCRFCRFSDIRSFSCSHSRVSTGAIRVLFQLPQNSVNVGAFSLQNFNSKDVSVGHMQLKIMLDKLQVICIPLKRLSYLAMGVW